MLDRFTGMQVLARVAALGSFSAAARALGISQTMATKHIDAIEDRLGARLFHRTTRRLTLTEAGQGYLQAAERILAEIEEAEGAAAAAVTEPRGTLRLNLPLAFGLRQAVPAIADFAGLYPALTIDIGLTDRFIDLVEEGWDLALRIGQLRDSSLVARKLAPIRTVLCAAPAYLERHGRPATLADLAGHNCLGYTLPTPASAERWRFGRDGDDRGPGLGHGPRQQRRRAPGRGACRDRHHLPADVSVFGGPEDGPARADRPRPAAVPVRQCLRRLCSDPTRAGQGTPFHRLPRRALGRRAAVGRGPPAGSDQRVESGPCPTRPAGCQARDALYARASECDWRRAMSADAKGPGYQRLETGDPAPWFSQRTASNPRFVMDVSAGRYIVLGFYGSAEDAIGRAAIDDIVAQRHLFDDSRVCFFGVSIDPRDESGGRVADMTPGIRHFLDFDLTISRLYGAVPTDAEVGKGEISFRRFFVVLDPTLRVLAVVPFENGGTARLFDIIAALPPPDRFAGIVLQAPVLFLPNVFEPEFCEMLIGLYEKHGGQESGFMREVDGKTVEIQDKSHKQRRDYIIERREGDGRDPRPRPPEGGAGDQEDPPVRCDPDGALHRLLLRRRGRRPLPRPPRQHHQGHGAPPLRGVDQPQRRRSMAAR